MTTTTHSDPRAALIAARVAAILAAGYCGRPLTTEQRPVQLALFPSARKGATGH